MVPQSATKWVTVFDQSVAASTHPNDPSQNNLAMAGSSLYDNFCLRRNQSPRQLFSNFTNLRKMLEMLKHCEQIATIPLSYRSCDHGVQQAKHK
jgi:hypothetical protein